MTPLVPTATPTFGLAKATRRRSSVVPVVRLDQAVPFVVRKIVPASPTTTPVLPLVRWAPRSTSVVPLTSADHEDPPLVVLRIVPATPTSTPVLPSAKDTPRSVLPWGTGFCQNQPDGPAGGG